MPPGRADEDETAKFAHVDLRILGLGMIEQGSGLILPGVTPKTDRRRTRAFSAEVGTGSAKKMRQNLKSRAVSVST
jgi:hypothetical protein